MGKYVTLYHTMWAPFFKTIFYLQNPPNIYSKNKNKNKKNLPNIGRLQICELRKNGFFHFIPSMITKQRKELHFFSFLFFSSLLQPFQTYY